jgi:integrase
MKMKSIKSFGSLVLRGKTFYAFWRVKTPDGKLKAICKSLRDENGAAITTRPEAEKAKARLMEIVHKEKQVASLRSIAHAIDDTQGELQRLHDKEHPPLSLMQTWSAFLKSPERRDCSKATLDQYEIKWEMFHEWMKGTPDKPDKPGTPGKHPEVDSLRDVTSAIASEYMQSLNHGKYAPATYNFTLFTLRYLFKTLKDEAKLPDNVWLKQKSKTNLGHSRRELTLDELNRVCRTATGEMKVLFAVGAYTGLRLGDASTLKWCEVDLHRLQIKRVPNKVARRCPRPITIPIHPDLAHMLADIPANERDKVFVLPETARVYNGPARSCVARSIQKHFEACGIETNLPRETGQRPIVSVGFHSLRHTLVSMMREANAPLSVVEALVGHHSVDMTRHYTHTSELAASNAVNLLPDVTGDPAPKPVVPSRDDLLREIIASMTVSNLPDKKTAALALLAGPI